MRTHRAIYGGFVLTTVMLGCASSTTKRDEAQREPSPDALSARRYEGKNSGPGAEDPDSTRALTRKTTEYAQSVEPLMGSRRASKPATGSETPVAAETATAAEPSAVKWVDPEALKLGGTPPPPAEGAATPPLLNPAGAASVNTGAHAATPQASPITASSTIKPGEGFPILSIEGHDVRQPESAKSVAISTDALQSRLATRIRDFPRESSAHLDYQLMQFLQDRPAPDFATMSGLNTEDRQLLAILMDGLTNFRSLLRNDSNMLLSRKARPLIEMADRLRAQSDLTLPTVALCKSVKGFGLYDPIDAQSIPAGKDTKAIVYCEVANFASQLDDKQGWQTKLTQEVVLYTEANGMRVWRKPPEAIVDVCRNRRHDFYAFSFIQFPANLPIGQYVLKVSVVDQQANRVAETTLPVAVVAN